MKFLFLSLCLSFSFLLTAQNEVPKPVDSKEAFENYAVFSDDESYENALDELNSIQVGDTSYMDAQVEKSLVLVNLERYDEAIAVCKEGMKNPESESNHLFRLNWAYALTSKGDSIEAMKMFDDLIKDYPFYIKPYSNKAQLYLSNKEYKESYEVYKQMAILFPFDSRAHYNLGVFAYNEGNFTECFMAFNMVLMLSPDSPSAQSILAFLNEISNNSKADSEPKEGFKLESEEYEDIDLLVKNYAALTKKYKVPGKSKIYLAKQNHLIMTQLLEKENTDYFFSSYYEPIYEKIMEEGYFETMQIFELLTSENENHVKLVEKNIKDLKAFNAWIRSAWYDMNKMHKVDLGNIKGEKQFWYYDNGEVSSVGGLNADGTKDIGYTKYYYSKGLLKSEGNYNEEGRDGEWKFYHPTGNLSQKVSYKDGKVIDTVFVYNKKGVNTEKFEFKNEDRQGYFATYYMNGNIYISGNYDKNRYNGKVKYFFKNGNNEYEVNYKEGELDGTFVEKYANGNIYRKETYSEGKSNGDYELFTIKGKTLVKGTKEDGEFEGKYQNFYQNGQMKEDGQFEKGLREGNWKLYFITGELAQETVYSKGEYNGLVKYYDDDGKVYSDQIYKDGYLISYKYFDKEGSVLSEGSSKKKVFPLEIYSSNGILSSKGDYKAGIGYVGEWESYTDYGVLEYKYAYEEGKLEGATTKFHPWGSVATEKNYKEGVLDGLYTEYYGNGIISQQGYYEDGNAKGLWVFNYENGTRRLETYYFNDKRVGNSKNFAIDGKLKYIDRYDDGVLVGASYYDSLGNVMSSFDYKNGEGIYERPLQNKVIGFRGKHIINSSEGMYNWYYSNGNDETKGLYLADREEGEWKWYHYNKQLSQIGTYENGAKVGTWEYFWEDGTKREITPYISGDKHGNNISYNRNGSISQETTYVYGEKHGEQKFYDDNGVFQMARNYDHDVVMSYNYLDKDKNKKEIEIKEGNAEVKAYYPNGNLSREFNLVNGYFDGKYKTYYENGNVETEYVLKFDERDGEYKIYYPSGKLKSLYNYKNGKLNGTLIDYYENGKIKEKENYINGVRHGSYITYSPSGKVSAKAYFYDGHRYER